MGAAVQLTWRHASKIQNFRARIALKRIQHGALQHRANRAVRALEQRRQAEIETVRAATKLQAGIRRKFARRRADEAARSRALGLLREHWGANREARALGASRPSSHAASAPSPRLLTMPPSLTRRETPVQRRPLLPLASRLAHRRQPFSHALGLCTP